MNKQSQNSYKQTCQITTQQNLFHHNNQQTTLCSPFRKHLPVIFETQSSPHKQFNEKTDYLQSDYESRLIEGDRSLYGSGAQFSIPNDSQLLNVRQRQLLSKIYQKQKQLVILEDRMFLLKNTNQCLRETIQEGKYENDKLCEQGYKLREQKGILQQKISELNNKIIELQQKQIKQNKQQKQEQRFFDNNDFECKSERQIMNENRLLREQIQGLKSFYQQQFYRMLQRNQQSLGYLQDKLKGVQKEKIQLLSKIQNLENDVQIIKNQKKDMLQYYLGIIDQMKRQMISLNAISTPVALSEKFIQQNHIQDKSYYCPQHNYSYFCPQNNYSYLNDNQMSNGDKSVDLGKLIKLQTQNQLLMQLVGKSFRNNNHNQSRNQSLLRKNSKQKINSKQRINGKQIIKIISRRDSKSIKKSQSSSSLQYNKNLSDNLVKMNTTLINYKYTQRLNPVSRYKLSPMRTGNISKQSINTNLRIKTSSNTLLSIQTNTLRAKNSSYNKKYEQIDKKLQQLKQQLTKQITY